MLGLYMFTTFLQCCCIYCAQSNKLINNDALWNGNHTRSLHFPVKSTESAGVFPHQFTIRSNKYINILFISYRNN